MTGGREGYKLIRKYRGMAVRASIPHSGSPSSHRRGGWGEVQENTKRRARKFEKRLILTS